jgi:hypothetical protein
LQKAFHGFKRIAHRTQRGDDFGGTSAERHLTLLQHKMPALRLAN